MHKTTDTIKKRLVLALQVMTKIQRPRWKLRLKGWKVGRIAKKQGVSHQAVSKCLINAEKRAKKMLKKAKNGLRMPYKGRD